MRVTKSSPASVSNAPWNELKSILRICVSRHVSADQNRPLGSLTVGLARLALEVAFSSLVMVHFRPATVLRQALASAGLAPFSPSQVAQSSLARNAGIRSDSACSVVNVRIRSLAGTVTITQARNGAGSSETENWS